MKFSWSELYEYFFSRGLLCYTLDRIASIIIGSVISFIPIFLFGCLQFKPIRNVKDISELILPITEGYMRANFFVKLCSFIFTIYTLFLIFQFICNLPRFIQLHLYFKNTLKISDRELSAIIWNDIVEVVLTHEKSESRTFLSVAQEILRYENYIIALISDPSVLMMKYPLSKKRDRIPMSRFFFYLLHLSLSGIVLDSNGCSLVNGVNTLQNMKAADHLKTRFRIIGILMFLFSPFILAFQILYLIFHYAEAIRNSPGTLSLRRWTPQSKWLMREYNELPHLLSERIRKSYLFVNFYLDLFPSPIIRPIARIGCFLTGTLLAIFFVFGIFTDSGFLLTIPIIGDRTLAWLISILASVYGICKMLIPNEERPFDPDEALEQIEKNIHYDFRDKSNSARSWKTYDNLCEFFQPLFIQLLSEIMSVFYNPFIFYMILPQKSQSIVDFIERNSVNVPDIGWICSFSQFDETDQIQGQVPEQAEKLKRSIAFFNESMTNQETLIDFNSSLIMPDENISLMRKDECSSNELLNDLTNEYKNEDFIL